MVRAWKYVTAAALVAALFAGSVEAQPQSPHAVIELFTSQGCSSCPAADKLAAELAKDPGLVVVSMPVDYWDYLGWKDTLARASFTERQKAYASQRGDRQVYTPQVVVNGVMHAVGSNKAEISNCANRHNPSLTLDLAPSPTGYRVSIPAQAGKSGTVILMPITRTKSIAIARGENRGATVTYTNVVRRIIRLAAWTGDAQTVDIPAEDVKTGDADAFIVMLQTGSELQPGQILAAAKGPGL